MAPPPERETRKVTGERLRREMFVDHFNEVLKSTTYREREIVKLRYGIEQEGDYIYTLREVGKIFQVTGERIRQVEARTIRKLRHPKRLAKLKKLCLLGEYAQMTMPPRMAYLARRIRDGV